jgi:(p)ppGpp synthase/HD superfamily hydrolase
LKRLSGGKSISWSQTSTSDVKSLDLVDLIWDKSYAVDEQFLFLAEISLICEDRKLLLADCSEVVSDMSEIVKTGSLSTKEHAILNFLVKIESLDHLQKLMNSLREIPSVMSVERTVST